MPRQQGLLLRGSRWYSNIKVPKDLREALGKEHIRESLGTSDYRQAARKVAFARARWEASFANERRALAASRPETTHKSKRQLTTITQGQAFEFACRFLALKEKSFREWMDREGNALGDCEVQEIVSTLGEDHLALNGSGPKDGQEEDGSHHVRAFLKDEGIECAPSSPAFQMLRPLIRESQLEHLARSIDLLQGKPVVERNNAFRGVSAYSPAILATRSPTIADLIARKEKANQDLKRSQKTVDSLKLPARLLCEVLGKDKPLSSITREDMHRVFDLMRQMPVNAAQRYKGKTILQVIEAASEANDLRKQKQNTLWNHYVHISALFNFAVDEKMMSENPAASRHFRQQFAKDEGTKPRAQFTIDELNKMFRAPLYSGCQNDDAGYANPGNCHPKRGRFWVPLLALFHGMRCNEACQIYTEDVKTSDGILFVSLREEREDGTDSDKKLKTKQSVREVPIHPELLRLGFAEFVAERAKDTTSPRLFPELTGGHKGYFSDAFSKWFVRFVKKGVGPKCTATMHSFRHQFRDATRAARLPVETVARLAGWEHGDKPMSRQMAHYGRGTEYFRALAKDVSKVKYPGLDLSHLYLKKSKPKKVEVRER